FARCSVARSVRNAAGARLTCVIDADAGRAAAETVRRSVGGPFRPGLSDTELAAIESPLGIPLAADHREFLSQPVPDAPRWPDWRTGVPESLQYPIEGIFFDVEHNACWHPSWGPRGEHPLDTARSRPAGAPRLLPVYSHRYVASAVPGSPVLSV